jgi:hypothetical protein
MRVLQVCIMGHGLRSIKLQSHICLHRPELKYGEGILSMPLPFGVATSYCSKLYISNASSATSGTLRISRLIKDSYATIWAATAAAAAEASAIANAAGARPYEHQLPLAA